MLKWINERLNFRVALGAAGASLALCALCGLISFFMLPAGNLPGGMEGAAITLIPYPSSTPTAVPIPDGAQLTPDPGHEGLSIGKVVQIAGSANGGLNLRSAPGVNNPAIYLAFEGETYQIKDGPVTADGYTWWNLAASEDPSLSGWAAGDFLEAAPTP